MNREVKRRLKVMAHQLQQEGMDVTLNFEGGQVIEAHLPFCKRQLVDGKLITIHNHPPNEKCRT
jgi:hypothetical protein